jgi:hypothetical protein
MSGLLSYDQYWRLTEVHRFKLVNGVLTEDDGQKVLYHYDSNAIEAGFRTT